MSNSTWAGPAAGAGVVVGLGAGDKTALHAARASGHKRISRCLIGRVSSSHDDWG